MKNLITAHFGSSTLTVALKKAVKNTLRVAYGGPKKYTFSNPIFIVYACFFFLKTKYSSCLTLNIASPKENLSYYFEHLLFL